MYRQIKKALTLLIYFILVMITPCEASFSRILGRPQHFVVPIGGAVDFDCRLTDPKARVELYHKTKHIKTDGAKVSEVGQVFTVYNVSSADSGSYVCKSPLTDTTKKTFQLGKITAVSVPNLNLNINVSPKINTAIEGESTSFICRVSSTKFATVSWFKDSKELAHQNKTANGNDYTSVVKLTDLEPSEGGIYECRVKVQILAYPMNIFGFFPKQAELILKDFKFTGRKRDVFVGVVGSSFKIDCNTTDPSASTSLWIQRSHQSLQQVMPDGLRIVQKEPSFIIHRVTIQDGGTYFCKAVSAYGKTISMEMGRFIPLQGGHRNPKAYISPHTKNLNLDKDFNFTCQAFGDSINFTWYKDGSVIPPEMVLILPKQFYQGYTKFESILMLRNTERSDEGHYTCQITSGLQPGYIHNVTANLTIYECPKPNGKFRDPFNSTLYIECVNGTGTRQECPLAGQYWDDSIKDCQFPASTPTTPFLTWIGSDTMPKHAALRGSFKFDCRLTDPAIPVQLKKDKAPVTVDGKKVKLSGQEFTISDLHLGDSGKYSCHANGVMNEKKITISVSRDLTPDLTVRVLGGNNRIELETTFNKTLQCVSYNVGKIRWYKVEPKTNKLTLVTKGPKSQEGRDGQYFKTTAYLELLDVTQKDAGIYMCRKNNSVNAVANTTIEVIVKAPIKPTLPSSLQKIITEHKLLQFKVGVSGSPFPDIIWYNELGTRALVTCRGGQRFTCTSNQKNYQIDDYLDLSHRDPQTNLLFKILDPSYPRDNGLYLIKARNAFGQDKMTLNVSVIVPPEIKKNSEKVTKHVVSNNSSHLLVCEARRAVPSPKFSWQFQVSSCLATKKCKPSPSKWQPIHFTVAKIKKTTSMRSVLEALPTDKMIYYRCNAQNTAGNNKKDFALYRTSHYEAVKIEGLKIKYRDEHENITMVCRALKSFIGPPSWRNSANRLITNTSRVSITVKESSTEYVSSLQIFGAQINDSGKYACEAVENDGKKNAKSANLIVLAVFRPVVNIGNLTVNETNHVILPCMVSGHPSPDVTWLRENRTVNTTLLSSLSECRSRQKGFYRLNPKTLDFAKKRTHHLVICNAEYVDSGWYRCKATNSIGQDEGQAYLNVQASPTVVVVDKELPDTVKIGDTVEILCQATGNPTPYVRWLKENENDNFVANGNISTWVRGSSTLIIREMKLEHYGKYRCVARNELGQDHKDKDIFQLSTVNKITSLQDGTVSKPALIAIVVSGSLVILLLLVIIAVLYRRKKLYGGFYILTLPPMPDYIKKLDPSRPLQEQTHKLPFCADWEFPRNRLTLGKVIGSGAFGQVFLADAVGIVAFDPRSSMKGKGSRRRSRFGSMRSPYYNNKQVTIVACKGLKEDATESEYKDLVSELKILMHIGEHKNIVNLLGACTKGRECDLLVIIEYCPHGNLLEFLRKRRDLFEGKWAPATEKADERFTTTDLVITAFQVARAMEFLTSRRCVHRDLAARNVLVGENYVMKVADFGLARDIYKDEHYVKTTAGLLPVKWMAIEALVDRIYTHQSDVWSFGVLLWEIFTLGGSPYPGLPANEVYQYLMEGQRMEQPHDCPDEIYALMLGCWEHDSSCRPTFSAIVQAIDNLLQEKTTQTGEEYLELENEQDVNENQPYYLEPEDMHPVSPVFDSPQASPLPPIPAEEIELQHLIHNKNDQAYLNKKEFVFCDLPKNKTNNKGMDCQMEKARADFMEKETKKSESSANISDEEEFISEKEHLMKDFYDEKDACERNSGVFESPPPYINTRPYANVNNFIKNYGNDGAASKKEDGFRPRQQSARYV